MEKYDFYDYDKAEKLREQHCKMGISLYRRLFKAKEKDDHDALEKVRKAMAKHKEKGEQMKKWADEAGFYWYP